MKLKRWSILDPFRIQWSKAFQTITGTISLLWLFRHMDPSKRAIFCELHADVFHPTQAPFLGRIARLLSQKSIFVTGTKSFSRTKSSGVVTYVLHVLENFLLYPHVWDSQVAREHNLLHSKSARMRWLLTCVGVLQPPMQLQLVIGPKVLEYCCRT